MLRPIRDRVIVEPIKKTGTLWISETDEPAQGVVIACGGGRRTLKGVRPLTVRVGDRILYPKAVGQQIKSKDKNLLVMNEEDILGIIEE